MKNILIVLLLMIVFAYGQKGEEKKAGTPYPDSLISLEQLEASIKFLEDSQKVTALVEQLRELANLERIAQQQKKHDTGKSIVPEKKDLYEALRQRFESGKKHFTGVSFEMRRIIASDGGIFLDKERSKLLIFGIIVGIYAIVFLLIYLPLRRLCEWLKKRNETGNRIFNDIAKAARQLALPFSCGVAAFTVKFIPSFMEPFFRVISTTLFIYSAVLMVLLLLLSSDGPVMHLWREREKTAAFFIRYFRSIARLVLLSYTIYALAGIFKMEYTQRLILWLLQIVMVVVIPFVIAKFRPLFLEPIRKRNKENAEKKLSSVILETGVKRLSFLSFLLLMIMTMLLISGKENIYSYLLNGILKTLVSLLIGGFCCLLWHNLIQRTLNGTGTTTVNRDFIKQLQSNSNVIRRGGYVCIGLVVLFYLYKIWGGIQGGLFNSDIPVVRNSIRIAAIVAGIWIMIQVAFYSIKQFGKTAKKRMLKAKGANPVEIEKRVDTLSGIFHKIVTVSLIVIGVIMVMDELGFDIKAMVAGVGIVGLAVGFGAQNLVRDVISGLFVIFENKIRVGDVAVINGTGGLVEQVNLRTSVLRGLDGTIHVFPNGEITSLSNMTHEFSYYVFDIGIAYKEDTDKVVEVLKQIGEEIRKVPEYNAAILEPLEILGVDAFADSAVIIKARVKTAPIKQWFVGREMNRRIKKRFDELDIEIPFPHQTVYFGEASKPFAFKMDTMQNGTDEKVKPQ